MLFQEVFPPEVLCGCDAVGSHLKGLPSIDKADSTFEKTIIDQSDIKHLPYENFQVCFFLLILFLYGIFSQVFV